MFSVVSLSSTKKNMMKKGTEYLFKYIKTTSDRRDYLIEPMSCIIRIGILTYKDPGTKICIYDNSISYYEPTIIQGMLRTWNGDNREDLHNLYNPIIVGLKWFNPAIPFYRGFFERCRDGIIKLKTVYESNSIIHHTLNHYIRTINEQLEKNPIRVIQTNKGVRVTLTTDSDSESGTCSDNTLGDESYDIDTPNDLNTPNDSMSAELDMDEGDVEHAAAATTDLDVMKASTIKNDQINFIEVFRDLWSDNELNIVNSTFNQLNDIKNNKEIRDENQRKEIMKTYLNSIEIIVKQKEKQVKNIIYSTITTY